MIRTQMGSLRFISMEYDPADLERWKRGDYSRLMKSGACHFITRIICTKAGTRRKALLASRRKSNRRFFGEALVAAKTRHDQGWFGSFKWLTHASWLNLSRRGDSEFHREFREGLHQHFADVLPQLQRCARRCEQVIGVRPVAPDLWLVARGKHRFIEVKLPGDSLNDRQLAGFAVLATAPKPRVSLEVVTLYPKGTTADARWIRRAKSRFREFCEKLDAKSPSAGAIES
jgi:hypothetical protein